MIDDFSLMVAFSGVILIFGVYPFWDRLRQLHWMKKALVGVNAGALGLIVAAFFILWAKVPVQYSACAVLGCCLVAFYDINTPLAIGSSGVLGLVINLLFTALANNAGNGHVHPPLAAAPMYLNSTLAPWDSSS
jgi:chromate transport protein ChrA